MVNRNDVARAAGVSPAVVSYVLNNGPRPVAAATRERVLIAISALGYQRDGRARALKLGRSETIGLVVPDITNPFFAELAQATQAVTRAWGRVLLVGSAGEDDDGIPRYLRQLAEQRVEGLLIVSTLDWDVLGPLTALKIPVVGLDRPPDDAPVSTMRIDNQAAALEATRHLLSHGHHQVCLINGPPDSGVAHARYAGWRAALERPGRVQVASYRAEAGEQAMASLLRQGPVTAVLVASDIQAIGAQHALAAHGLRCPQDVAIISIDGTLAGRYAPAPLTTIVQPVVEMAHRAVSSLLGPVRGPTHVVLGHELLIRRSCGCDSS